ncbi:MAG TPA: CUAEP/CCAEP-tail radical SAM protein [Bryobacteraceae bacterium]|nr:CUAEP/CCAEP-tail radical SAM protein [Bryobacteraceae bacterium]
MRVVLISTYDLGHQPFGLASPAAWLRADGHEVTTADLSREEPPLEAVRDADWIAFHLPMHTATRLAIPQIEVARQLNPRATICCYGLYAPVNQEMLRGMGVTHIVGGEFERALADLIGGRTGSVFPVVLDRLPFLTPDRTTLPQLSHYAGLVTGGERRVAGYTEASRGCKHLCRHCPIVPVYEGKFRVVQREVVLADVRQQVAAGARHITFGDPDFLNGPGHARALVEAFHAEFPDVTYDVTIKVEHLLNHREMLPVLARTGCAFITSAVESVDDRVLDRFAKGHTRSGFVEAVKLTRAHGLTITPTFVAFTPWTTREGYLDLLRTIRDLDLIENVAPVQLAIRLLIPAGSKLLELDDLKVGPFDAAALTYPWAHPDPSMDRLCSALLKLIRAGDRNGLTRSQIFAAIWERACGEFPDFHLADRATIPYLTEPWYC